MRHELWRGCRQALVPSLPPPSPSEGFRWEEGTTIRLQDRSRSRPNPRKPKHSRGLSLLLAGNNPCSSLAPLRFPDSRDTYPSSKADKPLNSSPLACLNESCRRLSVLLAIFQIQHLRSPAALK